MFLTVKESEERKKKHVIHDMSNGLALQSDDNEPFDRNWPTFAIKISYMMIYQVKV